MRDAQTALNKTQKAISTDCFHHNKALGESQAIMLAVTRDSSALDRSNWRVIVADLKEQFSSEDGVNDNDSYENVSNWHIERFSHCVCGWIDYLIVNVYKDSSAYDNGDHEFAIRYEKQVTTPAFDTMIDWQQRLDNYPVANEEDWSNLESEELDSFLMDEISYKRNASKLTTRAPKSDQFILGRVYQSPIFNGKISSLEDYHDSDLVAALQALGYAYKRI